MTSPSTIVVGGSHAGMVVARELARRLLASALYSRGDMHIAERNDKDTAQCCSSQQTSGLVRMGRFAIVQGTVCPYTCGAWNVGSYLGWA
jgi:hypothetical protein